VSLILSNPCRETLCGPEKARNWPGSPVGSGRASCIGRDRVPMIYIQETSARCRAVESSSGSTVITRRARPGLAGLGPHTGKGARTRQTLEPSNRHLFISLSVYLSLSLSLCLSLSLSLSVTPCLYVCLSVCLSLSLSLSLAHTHTQRDGTLLMACMYSRACPRSMVPPGRRGASLRGYLAHKKHPTPYDHRKALGVGLP
jgi:hypothetical protein